MKNLLFICSRNKLRSPTAEIVFADYAGLETMSAGTNNDAETPLSGDLIEWADIIVAMEPVHKSKLTRKFRAQLKGKHVVVMGIPDNYKFMQPELISLLKTKLPRIVKM